MRNSILVIAIAFALAAPCSAIAGGKQSGGSSSKQNGTNAVRELELR
jgi:hypothetical protein